MTLTTCPKCGWDITHHLLLFNIEVREMELLNDITEIQEKIPELQNDISLLKQKLNDIDNIISTIEKKSQNTK